MVERGRTDVVLYANRGVSRTDASPGSGCRYGSHTTDCELAEYTHHEVSQGPPAPVLTKSARRKLIERASIMGLGFSLLVHIVITIIAALVTIDFGYADSGGNQGDDVDFALLTDAELAQMQSPEVSFESFEVAPVPTEALRVDLLSDQSNDDSIDELADSIAPSLNPGGGSLTSVDTSTGSAGAGTGDGASFFGLEAQGRRFAYIVDISGSMNTLNASGVYTRWEQTRAELIRSINGLDSQAQFSIVLYSTNAIAVFGSGNWTEASRSNKVLAAKTLLGFDPNGGTRPLGGFELVFELDPEADAIYFMTDGLFDTDVPQKVRQLNRRELIPVHTILFGELANQQDALAALNMMRNIAKQSGGKFTHIRGGRP